MEDSDSDVSNCDSNSYSPRASCSCSSSLSDDEFSDSQFDLDNLSCIDSDQEVDYIEHLHLHKETILSSIFEGFNGSDNDDFVVFSPEQSENESDDDENLFVVLNDTIRLNYYRDDAIDIWTLLDELELFINELGNLYDSITNAIRACLPVLLAESNIVY